MREAAFPIQRDQVNKAASILKASGTAIVDGLPISECLWLEKSQWDLLVAFHPQQQTTAVATCFTFCQYSAIISISKNHHFTGIGTEKIVACQRVWPMQLATKVSLLLERDWAALKLLLAHCPWLFHAGAHACAGQEIPTKDSSLKVNWVLKALFAMLEQLCRWHRVLWLWWQPLGLKSMSEAIAIDDISVIT